MCKDPGTRLIWVGLPMRSKSFDKKVAKMNELLSKKLASRAAVVTSRCQSSSRPDNAYTSYQRSRARKPKSVLVTAYIRHLRVTILLPNRSLARSCQNWALALKVLATPLSPKGPLIRQGGSSVRPNTPEPPLSTSRSSSPWEERATWVPGCSFY